MKAVDLHTHSNKSDGSLSPAELVRHAAQIGLSAIALTDHDTVEGLDEAMKMSHELNIEVIPGVELSCDLGGKDVHIVGLFIDYKNEEFLQELQVFVDSRDNRNKKMCHVLTEHGINIDYDELVDFCGDSVITRAHFARLILQKGYVKSLKEAFDRYIGDGCPCFVPREKVTPVEGIGLIKRAGGIPILAHPLLLKMGKDTLDKLVSELKNEGLMGLEALYCTYTPADERDMRALAQKYNLLISGGSDFHGAAKPDLELGTGYGKLYVPEEILDTLKKARKI